MYFTGQKMKRIVTMDHFLIWRKNKTTNVIVAEVLEKVLIE